MNISDLEQYLSKAAWILKGPIDASDFKAYIFPLLFFKRISDVYDEEVQAAFPDDNITFDFQVTPDMATNSLTAIASGSEHTDLLGIEISGFGLFMVDDIISDNFVPLTDMYGDMYDSEGGSGDDVDTDEEQAILDKGINKKKKS